MELTNPELIAIRDDYNRLARRQYTLTREAAPDGQYLYTVKDETGEPVSTLLSPRPDFTSMLVFGGFAFTGENEGFLEGEHYSEFCRVSGQCKEAEEAGDEERLLRCTIALHKLTFLAHLAE